jgi:putative membrane protein
MSLPNPLRGHFANFARGLLMGAADIIPGVSGGTMALIVGIYERLVTAISHVDTFLIGQIRRRKWLAAAEHLDLVFLIALACGILTGIGCMSGLMHYLLDEHVVLTLAAFFGLILASSLIVARSVEHWNATKILLLAVGCAFAYWLVALDALEEKGDAGGQVYLFVCGMVAICAMILPGISGSFILLIMGRYHYITGILKDLTHGELTSANIVSLLIFGTGCVVGVLSFSKFLRWLLARYHGQTMAVLCGFIIGSLRRVWPYKLWPDEGPDIKSQCPNILPQTFDGQVALALALAVAAFALVILLDKLSRWEQSKA